MIMKNIEKKTVVIIPCYNAEKTITHVVQSALEYVDNVIVVDDGSSDNSAQFAEESGANVYKHNNNQGVGAALSTGFRVATYKALKVFVILDADGAHNPENIPSLLETYYADSSLLTIGSRFSMPLDKTIPSNKISANFFAQNLVNSIVNLNLPDVTCGFRVFDQHLVDHLKPSEGFGFMYDMIFIAARLGKISFSPVDVRYDARDMWITKTNEMLDMLQACLPWISQGKLHNTLKTIIEKTQKKETLELSIEGERPQDRKIVIGHPIKGVNGYFFQTQHDAFLNQPHNLIKIG